MKRIEIKTQAELDKLTRVEVDESVYIEIPIIRTRLVFARGPSSTSAIGWGRKNETISGGGIGGPNHEK